MKVQTLSFEDAVDLAQRQEGSVITDLGAQMIHQGKDQAGKSEIVIISTVGPDLLITDD